MNNKIVADYDEKFVKTTILFGSSDGGLLFNNDEEFATPVSKYDMENLFFKGMVVFLNGVYYKPIMLESESVTVEDEKEHVLTVTDGVNVFTFVSYTEVEEPDTPEPPEETDIVITPTVPTFDTDTGVITIPSQTGTVYKADEEILVAGEQEPLEKDMPITIMATPDEGYTFTPGSTTSWVFEWES